MPPYPIRFLITPVHYIAVPRKAASVKLKRTSSFLFNKLFNGQYFPRELFKNSSRAHALDRFALLRAVQPAVISPLERDRHANQFPQLARRRDRPRMQKVPVGIPAGLGGEREEGGRAGGLQSARRV